MDVQVKRVAKKELGKRLAQMFAPMCDENHPYFHTAAGKGTDVDGTGVIVRHNVPREPHMIQLTFFITLEGLGKDRRSTKFHVKFDIQRIQSEGREYLRGASAQVYTAIREFMAHDNSHTPYAALDRVLADLETVD